MNNQIKNIGILLFSLLAVVFTGNLNAQDNPEDDYYKIVRVAAPEGTLLEVGGLAMMPNGNLAVATRRGDVFVVENPTSAQPYFRLFASGLHEVLGLAYRDGSLYCAQRSELTRLEDTNFDGKADIFETVYAWPLSGHYHEYSFGPKFAPDGSMFVTGNVAFGDEEWWRGESRVPWRGWTMKISPDGKMEPWATGMRSPAGLGMIDGEFFYTDNQGDWIGSGALWHVKKGAFTGHPAGLRWTGASNSPVHITTEELYAEVDPRQKRDESGRYIKPENIMKEDYITLFEVKEKFPELQLPSVWLPHGVLGISNSDIQVIPEGSFGAFSGQVLIGDQGQSKIMRVFLEKVNGEYQGAAWDFRSGFQSGVLRMAWANDGSLFVGETNRGWGSAGEATEGLQRLVYTGKEPFEMREVHAKPDGFEITFTEPVDPETARDLASFYVQSFVFKYHPVYGSPPIDMTNMALAGVKVADDGMSLRLVLENPKQYYVHRIMLDGLRSKNGVPLLHKEVYYTLNNIPTGPKLPSAELSTYNSVEVKAEEKKAALPAARTSSPDRAVKPSATVAVAKAPTDAEIKVLLDKWTCSACHRKDSKQVGPAWKDIAKRNYTNEKIKELVYNPQPQNWPDYATPMAPMPHVPEADVLKIAEWINSLN
ncbi:c-type cytochrome [Fulvivirga sedimenti]|uniref:Cytochrome c domain-containing protein n=1 Tax=Fulvivirga sedimenti TaxID=2879465 RepID=A0A9X1KV75_9BACT|nr:c-type cytochrome [Fulvivirga sedimenti]MCA6073505.1 hypothetical protein [Fulvivirga sedimenti]